MALEGNIVDAAKAISLGLATGFGAIGPGAGVGYLMGKTVEKLSRFSKLPISVVPNAGLPVSENGKTVFKFPPEEFSELLHQFVTEHGVNVVGGCCGTTPDHIRAVADRLRKPPAFPPCSSFSLSWSVSRWCGTGAERGHRLLRFVDTRKEVLRWPVVVPVPRFEANCVSRCGLPRPSPLSGVLPSPLPNLITRTRESASSSGGAALPNGTRGST